MTEPCSSTTRVAGQPVGSTCQASLGSGSMAAVVYDSKSDWLYFARNSGRPLWLLRLKNRRAWWFASTREILVSAFESVLGDIAGRVELLMPLASDHVHALSPLGSLVALPEVGTVGSRV